MACLPQRTGTAWGRGGYQKAEYGSYQKIEMNLGKTNTMSTTMAFENTFNF